MAADLLIRPARADDVLALNGNLRPADRAELVAASGPDTGSVLYRSLAVTHEPLAALHPETGELLCLYGVAPVEGGGAIWMLGTTGFRTRRKAIHREALAWTAAMKTRWSHLFNWADARNTEALRWLESLGFTIHPAAPFGVEGRPFHRFEM